ncbi:MAG: hypothetical protein ACI87E_000491 [Mariniblastus sp.]|jgi:hypothetical protein
MSRSATRQEFRLIEVPAALPTIATDEGNACEALNPAYQPTEITPPPPYPRLPQPGWENPPP